MPGPRLTLSYDPDRIFRLLVLAVVVVHVLFVIDPLDVLAPVDPGAVGSAMWHGHVPYRDFLFEYPPGAVIPFLLAGLVPHDLASSALGVQAALLDLTVMVLLSRRRDALVRYLVLTLLVFPF